MTSKNTLVIYDTATNRIVTYLETEYEIPIIDAFDSANYFGDSPYDPVNHDYIVGVNNYHPDIWEDASDDLTAAARADIGLTVDQATRYKKDVIFDIPEFVKDNSMSYVTDIIIDWDAGEFNELQKVPLTAEQRRTKLTIKLHAVSGGGIVYEGQDPINFLDIWTGVTDLATDQLKIEVRKIYIEDDSHADAAADNDEIYLRVSGGKIFGDRKRNLINGSAECLWQPPIGSGVASCSIEPGENLYQPGQEMLPSDVKSILMDYYPAPI